MPPRKKQPVGLPENNNQTNIIAVDPPQLKKKKKSNKNNSQPKDKKDIDTKLKGNIELSTSQQVFSSQSNIRAIIQSFHNFLNELSTSSIPSTKEHIIYIGDQLLALTGCSMIEAIDQDRIESEAILSLIGTLLERDVESSQRDDPFILASATTFCRAVVSLIKQYPEYRRNHDQRRLFQSHYAFELSLYILLSLVEKTTIASIFIENLSHEDILGILKSLSNAIPVDIFYLTQEMALEAICRICFFLTSNKPDVLKRLEQDEDDVLEERLRGLVLKGKPSIIKLLKNMRPYLTLINKDNPSIRSFQVQSINDSNTTKNDPQNTIWLDVCQSYACFFLGEFDIFVRLKYEQIYLLPYHHHQPNLVRIGITSGALPKRLHEVIKIPVIIKSNNESENSIEQLELTFATNSEAEDAKGAMQIRCGGSEKATETETFLPNELMGDHQHIAQASLAPAPHPQQPAIISDEIIVDSIKEMVIMDPASQQEKAVEIVKYSIATTKGFHPPPIVHQHPHLSTIEPLAEPKSVNEEPEYQNEQFPYEQSFVDIADEADGEIDIEHEFEVPPHIPAVVSVTATENISDLSEEAEEESYGRHHLREAKRLSSNKVDSLIALFAQPEAKPKKRTGAKSKSTKPLPSQRTPPAGQRATSATRKRGSKQPYSRGKSTTRSSSPTSPTATKQRTPQARMKLPSTSHAGEIDWGDDDANVGGDDAWMDGRETYQAYSKAKDSSSVSKRKYGKRTEKEFPTSENKSWQNPLSPFTPANRTFLAEADENLNYSEQMEVPVIVFDEFGDDRVIQPVTKTQSGKTPPLDQTFAPQDDREILPSWDDKLDNVSTSVTSAAGTQNKRKFGRKNHNSALALASAGKQVAQEIEKVQQPPPHASVKKKIQPNQIEKSDFKVAQDKENWQPKPKMTIGIKKSLESDRNKRDDIIPSDAISENTPLEKLVPKQKTDSESMAETSQLVRKDSKPKIPVGQKLPLIPKKQSEPTTPTISKETPISSKASRPHVKATDSKQIMERKQESSISNLHSSQEHIIEENISWERELIAVEQSITISPAQERITLPSVSMEKITQQPEQEIEESTIAESTKNPTSIPQTRKDTKKKIVMERTTTTAVRTSTNSQKLQPIQEDDVETFARNEAAEEANDDGYGTLADVTDFETTTHVNMATYHRQQRDPAKSMAPAGSSALPRSGTRKAWSEEEFSRTTGPKGKKRQFEDHEDHEPDTGTNDYDSLSMSDSNDYKPKKKQGVPVPSKKAARSRKENSRPKLLDVDSGSNDEESVYTMLVNEIVAINKQRAARKRSKLLDATYNSVFEQVIGYIRSHFEILSRSVVENEGTEIILELDKKITSLINEIDDLVRDFDTTQADDRDENANSLQTIEKNLQEFESLVNAYIADKEKETQTLHREIIRKRKSCKEYCAREMKSIYQTSSKIPRIGLAKDVAELLR